MNAATVAVTLFAGAGVGSAVAWVGQWYFRYRDDRRNGAVLVRQVTLMAASLRVMFHVVHKTSATEFDATLLPSLMAFLRSPEFLTYVRPPEIIHAYSALSVLEVQHLQFERLYPRFVDLHARAILGHLVEPEDKELERIEAALRKYAEEGSAVLDRDVQPGLALIAQRLHA
jgi:hypothetical protein